MSAILNTPKKFTVQSFHTVILQGQKIFIHLSHKTTNSYTSDTGRKQLKRTQCLLNINGLYLKKSNKKKKTFTCTLHEIAL